jgi:aminopeptidase N
MRFAPCRAVIMLAAAVTVSTLAAVVPQEAGAAPSSIGATGGGDPYFPRQGNGGYDVAHYALRISYAPASGQLVGHARIVATTTQRLTRFDLDLRRNLHVRAVSVDGHAAKWAQPADQVQELVIRPAHVLKAKHRFTVRVSYSGPAHNVTDPDGSPDGFIKTSDGAFVASEPQGSPTWFPVNDTPRDKATYAIAVTVPHGLTAVSNGQYKGRVDQGGHSTFRWRMSTPISSYLVTATIGRFDVTRGRTPSGVPYYIAVDPAVQSASAAVLRKLPSIVDYFSNVYGRYPFGSSGAIVDDAPFVQYALETATRPLFDSPPDVLTLAHELAHQWYGDDVTLARWRDIWINEGFAEFSSWLWEEHTGGRTTAQHLSDLMSLPASDTDEWLPAPGNPGSADAIFSTSVYDRGAATLAALREKLGDHTFFAIMRGWLVAHRHGNASVAQFTAYAAKVAHRNLDAFFERWLYKKAKP